MSAILLHLNTYDDADLRYRDLMFRPSAEQVRQAITEGVYIAVGASELDDLDQIWDGSQNGLRIASWSRDPEHSIAALGPGYVLGQDGKQYGYRSSMVGDVVLVDGHAHLVSSFGFDDLQFDVDSAVIPVIGGGTLNELSRAPSR